MTTDKMIAKKEAGIGWMIFNNPERHNAVSLEMWQAAGEIVRDFAADPEVRVMIVTGAGSKAFISGADISQFDKVRKSEADFARYNATTAVAFDGVAAFPKPSIAMVRGYCIGGGLALAICCDLRICTEGSKFGIPAAKLGLGYGYPGVKRLVDVVGPSFAQEIFFTARQFDAREAQLMGLVNRIVPEAELETYTTNYAATIAGNAPLTVNSIKRIVGEILKNPEERDLAACDRMVKACNTSRDYIEGRTAFMEKRKPAFTGG
jgi:enoyl-CoA hydratase/carnithine racemase